MPQTPDATAPRRGTRTQVLSTLVMLGCWWSWSIAATHSSSPIFIEPSTGAPLGVFDRWFLAPVFMLIVSGVWLTPGICLDVWLCRGAATFATRALRGAGLAALWQMGMCSLAKVICGAPTSRHQEMIVITVGTILLRLLAARTAASPPRPTPTDRRVIFLALALQVVAITWLAPQTFVQELTTDGIESVEMGLSLAVTHLPRNTSASGLVGLGVGMIAQAFPAHFCGLASLNAPAAARMPLFLFLPLIFVGVVALLERRAARAPGLPALIATALGTLAIASVLGLNASFDPYFADLGSPAALDCMTLVMLIGLLLAHEQRALVPLLVFAALAHFCRPSGLLFILFLGAATFMTARGERLRASWRLGVAAACCVALTFLYEKVYVPRVMPAGALGLAADSLLSRFRYLNFTDAPRLLFVVLPAGLVTPLGLLAWRRLDGATRAVGLVFLGWCGFFFVLARYAPHHFAPAMVLPWIVYWSAAATMPATGWRRLLELGGILGAAAGFWLAWPSSFDPPQPMRARAQLIDFPPGTGSLRPALAAADTLAPLVNIPWSDHDPRHEITTSPAVLAWYARRTDARVEPARLRVQPAAESRPAGATVAGEANGFVLIALSPDAADAVRRGDFRTDFQRPWLVVPRGRLLPNVMEREHVYDLDLRKLIGRR